MSSKKSFRNVLIISVSIAITIAMMAIWFSPVVDNSNQTQSSTSPSIAFNPASGIYPNRGYLMNNTVMNLLRTESQTEGSLARYELNSAFLNWYASNVWMLPSTNRSLTQQNITSIFKDFVLSDGNAADLVQSVVNNEPTPNIESSTINITEVVNNLKGIAIQNSTIYSNGTIEYLLTYRYTQNQTSLTYMVIKSNGVVTPVDPYVMETAQDIYAPFLWWSILWEVKLANFLRFDNYQNALNFKNFAVSSLTGTAIYDDIMTGLFYSVVGGVVGMYNIIWGLIAGLLGTAVGDIAGSTNPTTVAGNVNTLFNNQEATYGYFEVAYELDYYPYLVTQAYSVYGPIIGGSINLFSTVNPLDIFGTTELNDYIEAFDDFQNSYGLNNWVYLSPPSSWTTYFGY